MSNILTINAGKLVKLTAEELKAQKLVEPTEWSKFVKTGTNKERMPDDPDWWYHRSAAVLRSIAKLGPVGTQKLRTKFGSNKNRGHKPNKFFRASGSIIRKILQQLEKSKLIKKTEKGVHKGRILTPQGQSLLDKIAVQISKQARKDKEQ